MKAGLSKKSSKSMDPDSPVTPSSVVPKPGKGLVILPSHRGSQSSLVSACRAAAVYVLSGKKEIPC